MPLIAAVPAFIGGLSAGGAAMLGGGLAAAGAVGSSLISGRAADRATTAATNATNQNNATQLQIFNENRNTLSPFVGQGTQATGQVNALLGSNPFQSSTGAQFQADPGYQFRLNQGLGAVNQNFATQGALRSGGALKALNNYAQGQASQEYQNWFNRDQSQLANNNNQQQSYLNALQGQQQIGLGAASAQAGVGQNFANATGQNNMWGANQVGNAALVGANNNNALLNNLVSSGANLYGNYLQQRNSSYGGNNQLRGLY